VRPSVDEKFQIQFVPDEDFRNAMRYLVEKGIMII